MGRFSPVAVSGSYSPVAVSGSYSLAAELGLPTAVASLVAAHRPWRARAQQLWCVGLVAPRHVASSGPGIEPCTLRWQADSYPLDHEGSFLKFYF